MISSAYIHGHDRLDTTAEDPGERVERFLIAVFGRLAQWDRK
jgi:hypothetical protein